MNKDKIKRAKIALANIATMLGHYNLNDRDPQFISSVIDELVEEVEKKNTIYMPTMRVVEDNVEEVKFTTTIVDKPATKKNKGGRPKKVKSEEPSD